MRHVSEEQLILYRYGEAEDVEEIARHLDACEQCRSERDALEWVLSAADAVPVPERGKTYGAEVWRRLEPRLDPQVPPAHRLWDRPENGWTGLLALRRLVPAAAMAALIVAAFVAGRYWPRHQTPNIQQAAYPQARDRILLVAVGDHLDRSQIVLIELMNAAQPRQGKVDISLERERAEQLVNANRLYRQTAERTGEAGVASVLDELERVLLDVAHSPDKISSVEFRDLRRRIEAKGIIFKVRVIGGQVRARQQSATWSQPGRSAL